MQRTQEVGQQSTSKLQFPFLKRSSGIQDDGWRIQLVAMRKCSKDAMGRTKAQARKVLTKKNVGISTALLSVIGLISTGVTTVLMLLGGGTVVFGGGGLALLVAVLSSPIWIPVVATVVLGGGGIALVTSPLWIPVVLTVLVGGGGIALLSSPVWIPLLLGAGALLLTVLTTLFFCVTGSIEAFCFVAAFNVVALAWVVYYFMGRQPPGSKVVETTAYKADSAATTVAEKVKMYEEQAREFVEEKAHEVMKAVHI